LCQLGAARYQALRHEWPIHVSKLDTGPGSTVGIDIFALLALLLTCVASPVRKLTEEA